MSPNSDKQSEPAERKLVKVRRDLHLRPSEDVSAKQRRKANFALLDALRDIRNLSSSVEARNKSPSEIRPQCQNMQTQSNHVSCDKPPKQDNLHDTLDSENATFRVGDERSREELQLPPSAVVIVSPSRSASSIGSESFGDVFIFHRQPYRQFTPLLDSIRRGRDQVSLLMKHLYLLIGHLYVVMKHLHTLFIACVSGVYHFVLFWVFEAPDFITDGWVQIIHQQQILRRLFATETTFATHCTAVYFIAVNLTVHIIIWLSFYWAFHEALQQLLHSLIWQYRLLGYEFLPAHFAPILCCGIAWSTRTAFALAVCIWLSMKFWKSFKTATKEGWLGLPTHFPILRRMLPIEKGQVPSPEELPVDRYTL